MTSTTAERLHLAGADVHEGLRTHMLRVYNYLAAGIGLSSLIAWTMFQMTTTTIPSMAAAKLPNGIMLTAFGKSFYASPWLLVLCFAPLAIIIVMAIAQAWLGSIAAQVGYWMFVASVGLSASSVLIIYKLPAVLQILAATSALFAALSLYGYTTKRDLSGWGIFLFMGLLGLLFLGVGNIFMKSEAIAFAKAAAGVLIFSAFTAYDTQQIKDAYLQNVGNDEQLKTEAVWGALNLFIDFFNLLLDLLKLFGSKN
jgi:FtsH-binding integral membrane protein